MTLFDELLPIILKLRRGQLLEDNDWTFMLESIEKMGQQDDVDFHLLVKELLYVSHLFSSHMKHFFYNETGLKCPNAMRLHEFYAAAESLFDKNEGENKS